MKIFILNKIKKLNNFLLEIIAIFIGITASFWVENYRENLSKKDVREDIIEELYLNLELDSIRAGYVSDSLIGDGLRFYPDNVEDLRKQDNIESVTYMLAYMNIYCSFWQTKYAYNKLQNLQFEKTLDSDILEKIDFYYQVINELHGLKRSEIAKEMFIARKAYLNRKGIYVSFITTWDKIKNPTINEKVYTNFINSVLSDAEFTALYYERVQMFLDWQYSLTSIKKTATELRKNIRTYYKEIYGKNIDLELNRKTTNLKEQVIISE